MHKQVYVKVNAPCDEGISPLVAALNDIERLETVDSCENGAWGAYVFFTYGENWRELANLMQNLSSLLSELRLACGFSLVMEWLGSNDRPRAQLHLEPEHVAILTEGIRRVASTLNGRMSESTGGK